MRALVVPAVGYRPEVSDIAQPIPGAGEVLLRVQAAGLNPMDYALASGALVEVIEHRYPLVLGRDAVGVVEEVGQNVTNVSVGDEVIAHIPFEAPFEVGTLAEHVAVPAASVVRKPAELDAISAASLPLAGGTALAAVDAADVQSGQSVLVNGASGAVGRFAVQLLAQRGATVIATGSPSTADRLRELGATHVIDYTVGPVAQQVRELYPDGVDVLVNLWGETVSDVPLGAVKPRGRVSTIRPVPDEEAAATAGLTGGGIVIASPNAEVINRLVQGVVSGALQTDVSQIISLDEATDALETVAAGKAHGKIVVRLG